MTRTLYRINIPESAIRNSDETARSQLSKLGLLAGDTSVEPISNGPGQLTLNTQWKGKYAGRRALQYAELLRSDAVGSLPYTEDIGASENDGYYAVEQVDSQRVRPQVTSAANVDGQLVREGTRRSHWVAVETSKDSRANDFGSDETTYVGAPADASLVRWWDGQTTAEYPSPVATRTARFGDVGIYDVDAASFESPTLVYQPASYDVQGDVDVGVWDTYGASNATDVDGVVQWGRVFSTEHDPRGDAALVIENGLLRLTIDDDAETITAEEWDATNSVWSSVSLGTSSWYPVDLDVRTIAPARCVARVLFSDGSTRYALDMVLTRGDTAALWVRTENATSATPQGLIDLLSPIAKTTIYDSGDILGIQKRTEVLV